ncbi:MAG: aldolase/citrate lyase family protein [Gammaproteobacteria bacterium]|nr:aldolase/citrate lyase family protein [Gammaproteobacteria bacterium]
MVRGFRQRLLDGDTLFGTLLNLPSPAIAEVLAQVGFDWLFIDTEHGALGTGAVASVLQAVDRDLACIVRVSELNGGAIKRTLDMGAAGIIVPQVETAEHATDVVRLARYAPEGERGMGLARAHRYGFGFKDYLANANDEIVVVIQVEHARAVENIEQIAGVQGIDAVFIGPYDLSASFGYPGQVDHPQVVEAIEHVTAACAAAGRRLGYFGMDAAAVKPYVDRGYTLICAGIDCVFIGQGAKQLLGDLKT